MISGVQRSAKISAHLAIGQYWPYRVCVTHQLTAIFVVDKPRGAADDALSEGLVAWLSS
jgi:hypothetical protein